jgi:hypothetical protein
LLQSLKTLPRVRADLTAWLRAEGVEEPLHVVAPVLVWWLAPKCPVCRGIGKRVVKGTNRHDGRPCAACKGTGECKVPHSGRGRKLLTHIRMCMGSARDGLKTKFKHQKPDRRGKPEKPDLLVRPGERWRSRDGRLWDVLEQPMHLDPGRDPITGRGATTLLARLATDPDRKALYHSNGHPWREFRTGPTGADLVELVGRIPDPPTRPGAGG